MHACGWRLHGGSTANPTAAAEGETRFSRRFLDVQHRGGGEGISRPGNPACAKSSGGRSRCATRGERGKLPLCTRATRGAGRLHAPPCRLRGGSNAGPGGPDRAPSVSGCGKRGSPPASLPPAGKFPMRPERARRACRSIGRGAGERAVGGRTDRTEGKGGGGRPRLRMRSSAASGCPCACGARVTHAICKRLCSHIPTQHI